MPTPANHVWRPSSARVAMLDSFIPVPRGAVPTTPAPLIWAVKDPADVLDYILDISPALAGNAGDHIVDLDIALSPNQPGDLTLNSAAADGARAVLWLSGGQPGTTYAVTISMITSTGRSLSRTVLLPVSTLATLQSSPGALSTDSGALLTDQNGNPVLAL